MTRLVHLTDLHFGLHRAELVEPLRDAVLSGDPDVIIASGDLTQRALRGQFAAAMGFLRGLGKPFIVIPGNHDLPAYNPLLRLFNPFGPFRRGAARDLAPTLQVGRLRIFGVNTAEPLLWRGGVARASAIDRICRALRDGPTDVTNIAVCHHPLEEPPGFNRGETRGGRAAMAQLAEAGLHVVLSGHLHHWAPGLGIAGQTARPIFQMQTGTALCARLREKAHGFAVMDFAADRLALTPWIIDEPTLRYAPGAQAHYAYQNRSWHLLGQ